MGYVVVWQHVLGVACVLCAVQNETEWRVCCVLCRRLSTSSLMMVEDRNMLERSLCEF
jgi:hypothetical protein